MESEGSLPHSQVLTTCPYPEPDQPSPCPHPTSWWSTLILSCQLYLSLPSGLIPSCFPTKTLYAPLLSTIRAICRAHLILLDLITRMIFREEYKSLSSSLCSFLHSILGPNILLNTLLSKLSPYVPLSMWATKFHTHTKQQAKWI